MITRQQYLNALEIIDLYHRQNEKSGLTLIQNWDKFNKCSIRLRSVLQKLIDYNDERYGIYIEKINIEKMKLIRNCGQKSIDEFVELRGY
jgi:hypothetical protein